MFKSFVVIAVSALLSGGGHAHSSIYGHDETKVSFCCHFDKSKNAKAVSAMAVATSSQDSQQQDPPQESPPTHEYSAGDGCSRPNPEAEPGTELDGIEPNTVGCICQRKCVNGQTQEDLSRGANGRYICKNACHKDRCFCPNPCKT